VPDASDVAQVSPSFVSGLTSLVEGSGRTCTLRTRASVSDHGLGSWPRAPTAVPHRGLDGSTMEMATPP
jgi:hypothetical protein